MPQITLTKPSKSLWRATFDNPPVNLISSQTILELRELVDAALGDPDLAVILFESANPDFFFAHWDLTDDSSTLPPGPTGQSAYVDILIRISKLPVITVSAIRGRARGAGSEFLLATDIRFASRERARIGQFEVSASVIPGGGAPARLSRLVGRGRALEIMASADDYDGELAERYGYVNRAIPDAEFDAFIDAFVTRVSSFTPGAIRDLKRVVDPVTLPPDEEFTEQANLFFAGLGRPEAQAYLKRRFEQGLQQASDVELNLAAYAAS